ncbi:MAG: uracil-DNA glycosylase [Nitrospirae bacterium]|nr:uracil-DNA glycosylase [Nitrospirota bacterium]
MKEKALREIAEEIACCPVCKTWGTGKPVPGEGNADAEVVFIGEAPGKEEAKTGRPFVGRSGKLLREMIRAAGLKEEEVFITSPVHYLPLRGTPSRQNVLHGREHLLKQLAVIDPKIVVLLGNTACIALLGRKVGLAEGHGNVTRENGRTYFVTFHPAFAVRFPKGKKGFLRDFEKLKALIGRRKK